MVMVEFKRIIAALPYDWEKVLGTGVNFLAEELDAEEVVFKEVENGIMIGIVCDEDGKEKAKEFWTEHAEQQIKDNGEL